MKKIIPILFSLLILSSCRDNKVVDEPAYNPYGVVLVNNTNGQIYVESSQLVMGMPELESGASTAPIYSPTANVTVEYFGEGTYFKKMEKSFTLEKDKTITISLTYP